VTEGEAVIENLTLPRGVTGRVRLKFEKGAATPRGTFGVDVVQLTVRPGGSPQVVGGVSYEIRTGGPVP
jgi:hypothetical protein